MDTTRASRAEASPERDRVAAAAVCARCGGPAGPDDAVSQHSPDDPLRVAECPRCGAVLWIGAHDGPGDTAG